MGKFLLVYHGQQITANPFNQKEAIDTFARWFNELGKSLVDVGGPTMTGKEVSSAGVKKIAAVSIIAGYSILQAESLDEAIKLAKTHPDIAKGMKIDVYEMFPVK